MGTPNSSDSTPRRRHRPLPSESNQIVERKYTAFDPTRPIGSWRTAWRRLTKEAGLAGLRFHDLRHLHGVAWLKSGRSIYALQQRLGHTSVKTTEGYLRAGYLTHEEQQRAMERAA